MASSQLRRWARWLAGIADDHQRGIDQRHGVVNKPTRSSSRRAGAAAAPERVPHAEEDLWPDGRGDWPSHKID